MAPLAVELCGWKFEGATDGLGGGMPAESEVSAWTVASDCIMEGAGGSGCGGSCTLPA